MKMKAFITGITGQDGSYLAEFLLKKGYEVHGLIRRSSSLKRERIDHLKENMNFTMHYGDVTDSSSILHLLRKICPDEIYSLAAQSHVMVSFEVPEYTANSDALGVLRILEAVRILGLKSKIYQASTSEMFGSTYAPQNESSKMQPQSPYGTAKLYAYWIAKNYRDAYNIFISNGILFNHESPRRAANFVSRKITLELSRIKCEKEQNKLIIPLRLGNLDAIRDWGYAKEYVEVMWLILQQEKPDDFVIATGESHTVREFVEEVCNLLNINLRWEGKGLNEVGIDADSGNIIVKIDKTYFRPLEVNILQGDATKAKQKLGWSAKTKFKELAKIMVESDYKMVNEKIN